jgi:2-oxoglutarate ferredoxin oxidoreductase subunit delta
VETRGQVRVYQNDRVTIKINEDWCKGCSICVEFCPCQVLVLNRRGKPEAVDLDSCTRCGSCVLRCPDFAIMVE